MDINGWDSSEGCDALKMAKRRGITVSGSRFNPSWVSSRLVRKRNSKLAANTRAHKVVRAGTPRFGRERMENAVDDGAASCVVKGSRSSVEGPPNVWLLLVRFVDGPAFEVPAARLDISQAEAKPNFQMEKDCGGSQCRKLLLYKHAGLPAPMLLSNCEHVDVTPAALHHPQCKGPCTA